MTQSLSQAQFEALACEGYSRVPVTRTLLADTETPLSTYAKLCDKPYSFLFESVEGGEKWSRYSIVGLPARHRFAVEGATISRFTNDQLTCTYETADPLQDIETLHQSENSAPLESLPVFHGGWVGYFGYDTVRYVEPKLSGSANKDTMGTPDILLVLAEEVVVFDNLRGTLTLIVNADTSQAGAFERATERLAELELRLAEPMPALSNVELGAIDTTEIESRVEFETQQSTFESWVARSEEVV